MHAVTGGKRAAVAWCIGAASVASIVASAATAAPSHKAAAVKTLTIGAAVSASGSLFQPGSHVQTGYEFWANTVNKSGGVKIGNTTYKIKLDILDDQSSATTAATVAQKLISEDHVNFMFGPYSSGLTLAVGGIVERNKVVMIAPGGNANNIFTQGYNYVFGVIPLASSTPRFWLQTMVKQSPRPQTLAVLTSNDAFAQSQRDGIKQVAKAFKIQVVDDTVYSPDQQDFSTVVSKLSSEKPDLVAVLGHTQDSALIVQQMRDTKYYPKGVFYSGPAMLDFATQLGGTANFSYGATFWDPVMGWKGRGLWGTAANYAKAFNKAYNRAPSYQDATASAAGVILTLAMQAAKSTDPTAVRKVLLSKQFRTFEGPVHYASSGWNMAATAGIQQVIGGKVYMVFPTQLAQRKPTYPAPGWPH